ncbi:MAG TPA: phosphate ABC transporter permease PstA [Ktedonobacterales bacterium]|nr:phosphate ABC transporter permease PstA [Ktedonobacterales bacterium]
MRLAEQATPPASPRSNPFQEERNGLARRRRVTNQLAVVLTGAFTVLASLFLLYLIVYVAGKGLQFINLDFFTQRPKPPGETGGGWATALQGTAVLIGLAALIGVPLGMAVGIYLSEIGRGRFASLVRFLVDTLTGIPTVIFGLFAWVLIVVPSHSFSALSAGVALGIIMVPTVARATEEMLRLVPKELREASAALGATESRTVLRVVIPAARSGIVTGIMLALARVAGETAPLLLTAFGTSFFNTSLLRPIDAIPLRIFVFTLSPYAIEQQQAFAGALVLIAFVLLTSLAIRWATGGFRVRRR